MRIEDNCAISCLCFFFPLWSTPDLLEYSHRFRGSLPSLGTLRYGVCARKQLNPLSFLEALEHGEGAGIKAPKTSGPQGVVAMVLQPVWLCHSVGA